MSNEIRSNLNKYTKINSTIHKNNASCANDLPQPERIETSADAMNFLGAYGCAKVKMDKHLSTKNSAESFMRDPFAAELHNGFCDELVSRGYKLEDAINTTDTMFETLKDKNTYI